MPNNISVAVAADVTDLQVKFAVAKAETSALTTEMNKLARQSAAGIIDPAGQAKLQEIAGDLIKARAEAASLGAEFKEMTAQTQNVGGVLEEMGGKLSTAFQVTGIAIAAEAVRSFGELLEKLGERATTIRTSSDVLGVTGEQFQAMEMAAEEAGVSVETLTRAAEKMNVTLTEAREGSSAAIEKLLTLGVTTQQIADPTFKVNELFESLHERLIDVTTKQQEMNEISKEFGTRAALVSEVLAKYDGSLEGVREVMNAVNGLTDQQTQKLQESKAWWGEQATAVENASSKIFVAMTNMFPHVTAETSPALKMMETEQNEAVEMAAQTQQLNKAMLQQEMENAKAGIQAYKEGTQQRVDQLKSYAAAAAKYYGSDTVDIVTKANQEIIASQRALEEQQKSSAQRQRTVIQELTDFGLQMNSEIMIDRARIAEESAKFAANEVKEEKRLAKELYEGWEDTYTEITNKHAALLKQQNADTARAAKEDSKSWTGVVGEIEGAEGSMVSNILSKRKSLSQSLIQLSGDLVTKEIANDLRAITTRLLFQTSAANSQKALEQGGFLYHQAMELLKSATTKTQQTVQTAAVATGNTTRNAATAAAQVSSQATAAATGAPTVMADAAKAYAGTFASVAQIPYVGYIMAPAAAEASFAAVAAYAGMASLDTGTNYVPQDQIAQIHKGEAVVPKQFNPAANPFAASGGGHSEEHNYNGPVNISAFDGASMKRALSRPGGRDSVVNSAMRAYRRGAR